uniref:Uncharacterized protein n=1 Tax=Hemiselmis andersenii TaxID=464988 RepID=A0A7S1DM80_HEMAN
MDSSVVVCIALVRLAVLPTLGLATMWAAANSELLPPLDPLAEFVTLIQFTTPTGLAITTICVLHGNEGGVRETARIYLCQWLLAVPLVTAWMMVYMVVDFRA